MNEAAMRNLALSTGQRIIDLEVRLAVALAERDAALAQLKQMKPDN